MMKKLLMFVFIFTSLSMSAQEVSYHELALKYLQTNGTAVQYEGAIDQLFGLLKQQYAGKNISEATWAGLRTDSSGEVNRVLNMLVSAYRGTYEKEDLVNMLAFYDTGAGKQLLEDRTKLNKEQREEAAGFYNSPTGQKILSSEQFVSSRVSEVSELWSRDLYRNVTDKLAEKGFILD